MEGIFKDIYTIGDNGPEVTGIQEAIGISNADGIFGPATRKAVIKFQETMGLVADGVVGKQTLALLFPTTDNSESDEPFEQYHLPKGEYKEGPTKKEYLFLHHTAGWNNPYKCIDQWARDNRGAVATKYVIGGPHPLNGDLTYDGVVLDCIPEGGYGWHLGKNGSQRMHTHSIGIEVCNFGWLTKKGDKYYTYANTQVSPKNVCDIGYKFRGYQFWHDYSEAQIDALKNVILHVKTKYNIDVTKGIVQLLQEKEEKIAFDFSEDAYYGRGKGMWTHTNTRKDKTDMYPHPGLIKMLKSL